MLRKKLLIALAIIAATTSVGVLAQVTQLDLSGFWPAAGIERSAKAAPIINDETAAFSHSAKATNGASVSETPAFPTTIVPGQSTYDAGETVTISGRVWEPTEAVTLVLHAEPQLQSDQTVIAISDDDGRFTAPVLVLGEETTGCVFTVTATGASSGATASTEFTQQGGGEVNGGETPGILAVTPGVSPASLVAAIVGTGVTTNNITYTGSTNARGTFSSGTGIIGFEDGIVLSSGNVSTVIGPNNNGGAGTNNAQPGDAQLTSLLGLTTFDAAILEFDFIPNSNVISFSYTSAQRNTMNMRTVPLMTVSASLSTARTWQRSREQIRRSRSTQ
jgi:hypothetical protein